MANNGSSICRIKMCIIGINFSLFWRFPVCACA